MLVPEFDDGWMETAPLKVLPRFRQPGLLDLPRGLQSAGVRLAVPSDYEAGPKLEALGVAEYVDVVVAAQQPDVGTFKPHPRGLLVTCARLGVDPADAFYVGDRADVDATAADTAGVPCAILVEPGRSIPHNPDSYTPIRSFHHMRDRLVSS